MNNYYEVSKGILNMVKNTNSKEIIVPNGILEIGENAFKYCPNVTKIYLPNTLKKIGSYAFSSCKLLQDIIIPNSVTEIEKRAFFQCSGLVSIVLPIKLYTIKDETFYGCSQLKTVIIQQNLVKIGKFAFGDCSSLISIDFPENLEIIEFKAFFQCTSLRKLILPNNLKTIHYTAFNGCTSLEEVLLFENTKKFRYIFPKHIKIKSDISIEQAKFLNTALNIGISEDVFNQISIDINYTIINISICTRGLIIDTKENKYLYNTKLHKLLKFIDIVYCTDIPYDYAKNILDELCYFNRFQLHEFNRSAQGVFKNSYVKKEVLHFKEPNQFSIDDSAFVNMNELIWMYLNKPLEKIGYRAFYNCPDLKRIYA